MKDFRSLRVIEMAGSEAGAYVGKLFADLGANVVKVEPPSGDPRRQDGELWGNVGTTFAYLNTSKETVFLDSESPAGLEALTTLVGRSDVLVESSSPNPLRPIVDRNRFPTLVQALISPFGQSGPYATLRSNYFADEAVGGQLYLNGEPDREPIRRPGLHAAYQAGTHAFIGVMAALLVRERTNRGQTVEVSHFEGFVSLHQHTISMWTHGGVILKREGNRQPGQWHPVCIYPCQDGYVQLSLPTGAMLVPFLHAAGLDDLLADPRFSDDYARGLHKDEFDKAILPWLRSHSTAEIVSMGQSVFTPVGPVPGMLEVVQDEHLEFRDSWVPLAEGSNAKIPRGPFRVAEHPFSPRSGGPHTSLTGHDSGAGEKTPGDLVPSVTTALSGALDGIRVLDLTRVWAGPFAGRLLADLGADVIAVEMPAGRGRREVPPEAALVSHLYPENEVGERPWNRVASFNKLFRNRRGIALNLKHSRSKELFTELVRRSDIVLENFSPRVMGQLGFDSESLKSINPSVIHVSMPGFGATGPHANWVAYGPLIEASCGLSAMMGYADSGPYRSGVAWPDPVAGMNAAAGALVALWDREADSARGGRDVEVAMIDAMVALVGEEILAAQVRGTNPPRRGNREPMCAPQGCYPCAGNDRWIAISVTNDDEWHALCELAHIETTWSHLGLIERRTRHDEIDRRLAQWTRGWDPHTLMRRLQECGVIAAVVSDARDLVEDRHLGDRDFWACLDHPDVGFRLYPGTAIRLSETPIRYRRPAPTLGQHNDEILGSELGVGDPELSELRAVNAIAELPPAE